MNCGITGHRGILGKYFIKRFSNLNFIKYYGDINDKKKLKKWILKNDFKHLFHFAAIVPVHEVKKKYKLAKKTNYNAVKNIVDILKKKAEPVWFFFSSTSHVYGYSDKKFNELNKTRPINDYGRLKLLAENYIRSKLKNSNVNFCIGRIFSFTHFEQSNNFFFPGILKKNRNKHFLEKINTLRDFIDIRDICDALKFLMNNKCCGTFNIASGKNINLQNIFLYFHKNYKKYYIKAPPKKNILANIKKITKQGWKPQYDIYDSLSIFKKNKFI